MSGVESAGLVLSVFPLLIGALENYRKGAELLSDWWRFKREYRKVKDEISFHRLAFEQNLEKYLLPLIVDEDELQSLISDPMGEQWESPELEKRLKARLPRAYELYLSTISQMNETMAELQDVLGSGKICQEQEEIIDEDATLIEKKKRHRIKKFVTKANLEQETQRVNFAVGKSVRTKLFKDISGYNARLKELLDTSDEIEAIRSSRRELKGPSTLKAFNKLWSHASNMFNLLSLSWGCECFSKHHVNLMLQHRISSLEVHFTLQFQFSQKLVLSQCPRWTLLRTRIDLAAQPEKSVQVQRAFSELTIGTPKRPSMRSSMRSSTRKDMSPSNAITMEGSTESLPPAYSKPSVVWDSKPSISRSSTLVDWDGAELNNLCDTIANCKQDNACLGILKNEEYDYAMFPLFQETPLEGKEMVSLGSLLRKEHGIKLTRRQRFFIALTLASSHLQLHRTPWLEAGWGEDDILFASDPTNEKGVNLDQPFITRDFSSSTTTKKHFTSKADNSLPNLGIMMLELCFNAPFESQEYRKKYLAPNGQSNPYLDLAAAMEWCNSEAAEEAGPDFADAVRWCLGHFGAVGGLDETKKGEMIEKVVKPLEYCHKQFEISSQV